MSERHTLHSPQLPLLHRLSRWLGAANGTGRSRSNGVDSTRLDLGYEAAYAPALTENAGAPSRFEEDRPAA
jgi:hypothetical protein